MSFVVLSNNHAFGTICFLKTLLSSAGMLVLYDGYVDQHELAAAYQEAGVVTPFCAKAVVSCLGQERNLDLLCACVVHIKFFRF